MHIPKIVCTALLTAVCFMPAGQPRAELIVISEIMRNPAGKSDACPGDKCEEFIEFYNAGTDTLELSGLFLKSGDSWDSILPVIDALPSCQFCVYGRKALYPSETALILDREYAAGASYEIADSTVLLTVNHSSILGGLSDSRGVLIYRGTRETVVDSIAIAADSGLYAESLPLALAEPPNAHEGISLSPQRILFEPRVYQANLAGMDPGIWQVLKNGFIIEYRVTAISLDNSSIACSLAILDPASRIDQASSWEIRIKNGAVIKTGETMAGPGPHFFPVNLPLDTMGYEIRVNCAGGKKSVDIDLSTVYLPELPIRINELFPRAGSSVPEWIEIVNVSKTGVNLKNWRFGTELPGDTISKIDFILAPDAFCILTGNQIAFNSVFPVVSAVIQPEHWQALDNYRDTIHLWNPLKGNACETVYYDHSWFDYWSDGGSLERVDFVGDGLSAKQWVVSEIPSPGQPNRSTTWRSLLIPELDIGPVPFSPDKDGNDDLLAIRIKLPANAKVKTSIYGFNGDRIFETPQLTTEEYLWNGKTSSGKDAPAGPFFVCAEITQNGKTKLIRKKGILWRRR